MKASVASGFQRKHDVSVSPVLSKDRGLGLVTSGFSFMDELLVGVMQRTPEVSDRRRQERWSARDTLELPPSAERRSEAAVRSTDFVGLQAHGKVWTL